MDIALTMPTHGLLERDEQNFYLQRLEPENVRPFEFAQLADKLGFHSLWFSDHVVMGADPDSYYPPNESGKKAYPYRPTMFDAVVVMGGLAAITENIKFAPSVHIAPYRHPLSTAHQFATADYLSKGRLIMTAGIGWEPEEFRALGADFKNKAKITEECIEIWKRAWTDEVVRFKGDFFDIKDVTMDPKPWQQPRPPIYFGAVTELGSKRAARTSDGLYTVHLEPYPNTAIWKGSMEAAITEGERVGKDMSSFWFGSFCSCLPVADGSPVTRQERRPTLTGSSEQILEEMARFADVGYHHLTLHIECPSGTIEELFELTQKIGEEVLPEAKKIKTRSLV